MADERRILVQQRRQQLGDEVRPAAGGLDQGRQGAAIPGSRHGALGQQEPGGVLGPATAERPGLRGGVPLRDGEAEEVLAKAPRTQRFENGAGTARRVEELVAVEERRGLRPGVRQAGTAQGIPAVREFNGPGESRSDHEAGHRPRIGRDRPVSAVGLPVPVGELAFQQVGGGGCRVGRHVLPAEGGVDGGQSGEVDGQDLGVVLVDLQRGRRADVFGPLRRQAQLLGEGVPRLAEQLRTPRRPTGRRQQRDGVGGHRQLGPDPLCESGPPDIGRPGQQQDADRGAAAQQRCPEQRAEGIPRPAVRVVQHKQHAMADGCVVGRTCAA
nr:hypothetical protein [Streptomyces sp. TLI_235]